MLISQFATAAGVGTDTVRYYIKRGLLRPEQTTKGGKNPYHIFSEADLEDVVIVRVLKVLGFSLRAIAGIMDAKRSGRMSRDHQLALMEQRRQLLLDRAEEMRRLSHYLQMKIDWLKDEVSACPPDIRDFLGSANRA